MSPKPISAHSVNRAQSPSREGSPYQELDESSGNLALNMIRRAFRTRDLADRTCSAIPPESAQATDEAARARFR